MIPRFNIVCPLCGFTGNERAFDMSLSDECFCPACEYDFLLLDEEGDE